MIELYTWGAFGCYKSFHSYRPYNQNKIVRMGHSLAIQAIQEQNQSVNAKALPKKCDRRCCKNMGMYVFDKGAKAMLPLRAV